jgi:hypothetical protein
MKTTYDRHSEENSNSTITPPTNTEGASTDAQALSRMTKADQAALAAREQAIRDETPQHEIEFLKDQKAIKDLENANAREREGKEDAKEERSRQSGDDFELVNDVTEAHIAELESKIEEIESARKDIVEEAVNETHKGIEERTGRPLTDDEKTTVDKVAENIFKQSADSETSQVSYGKETDELLKTLPDDVRYALFLEAETQAANKKGDDYTQKGIELETTRQEMNDLTQEDDGEHINIVHTEQQTEGSSNQHIEHLTLEKTTRPEYLHKTAMEMVSYYKNSGLSMRYFKDDMSMLGINEAEQETILKVFDREGFELKPDAPAPTAPQLAESSTQPQPQPNEPEINNPLQPTIIGFS